jgi:uncharacterized protein (DUF2141 family)
MAAATAACHPFAPSIMFFVEGDLPCIHSTRKSPPLRCSFASALSSGQSQPAAKPQPAGKLSITVTGVRNGDGVVRCALFNSPAAFPKIGQEWRGVIAPIRGGAATCVFTGVPAGTYAVAFFHAEHNETQLTTGMFGKPTQGYGFSNNAAGSFGPPNFSAAAAEAFAMVRRGGRGSLAAGFARTAVMAGGPSPPAAGRANLQSRSSFGSATAL